MSNNPSSTSQSPTRDKIIAEIGRSTDDDIKAILMIVLAALEEIGQKIDLFTSTESLRTAVFDTHAPKHDAHHHWIEMRMQEKCEQQCTWVKGKIAEEDLQKQDKRKFASSMKEKIALILLSVLGTLIVSGLVQYIRAQLELIAK